MEQKIKVTVDKRTELLYVILSSSDYEDVCKDELIDDKGYPYKKEADDWFKKFKKHKAVSLMKECIKTLNFQWDAPVNLFLQLDNNLDFNAYDLYPFVNRLKKSPLILDLLKEVKKFAKDTNFDVFYESHNDFYNEVISNTEKFVKQFSIIPWMENFYKMDLSNNNYIINHILLGKNSGYGISLGNSMICCDNVRDWEEGSIHDKKFGRKHFTANPDHYIHEFSHPIVNPLTDKYYNDDWLELSEGLKTKMHSMAYSNLKSFINESIIRAVQAVYMKDMGIKSESISRYISNIEERGFVCTRQLYAKLLEYQNKKDTNFEKEFVDIASVIKNHFSKEKNLTIS